VTDDYGMDIPTVSEVETVCELQQQRRDERSDNGEVSYDTWNIFLLAGEEIETGDSVEVGGEVFELIGDPWPVYNPRTGEISHIEATARRTAGSEDVS
jgi:hypothetical protein